jgi:hypothetical protein
MDEGSWQWVFGFQILPGWKTPTRPPALWYRVAVEIGTVTHGQEPLPSVEGNADELTEVQPTPHVLHLPMEGQKMKSH